MNREIPVVADTYVDREFSTGVVKITPAHDPNDFEVGLRHNLEVINVMNEDTTINENGGNMQVLTAMRQENRLSKDLEEQGFLVKVKEHVHNVGSCYRLFHY